MQDLDAAVAAGIAQAAEAGETIEIGGFELAPSDLLIEMREREGAATAQDAYSTVAVTTDLTPALVQEGTAREIVHRLQGLRREAGFEIADRIVVWYEGSAAAVAAIEAHAEYVRTETLALELQHAAAPADAQTVAEDVNGERLRLGLRRA
jgi:isoleucyl-tRNA synthetase